MKKINHRIISTLLLMFFVISVIAQSQTKTISGKITDEKGEPLIGVAIIVKDQPGLGTTTDIDGRYTIKAGEYDVLVVKYVGYKVVELPVVKGQFNVQLEDENKKLDEVVVSAAGVIQRKATLSGAITTVDVSKLNVPTANLSNALVGNVAGIIGYQSSGEPGENKTEFWVRGISTFGANSKALVLVDGIERSLDELNYEDIESFSVLKDASATAIYGSRGANGVILITTKRGSAGKVNINFKAEYGYNTRSRTPIYTDGITYAEMANEACLTRYQEPIYSDQDIEIIRRNLDPDLFPNVNWQDVILKNGASNYRGTLSLSGGGSTARYYVSGSYYNEGGIYRTTNVNKYSTNVAYSRYNYRSNVDVNVTKTTLLKMGVSGYLVNQTKPGYSSDYIWGSLSNLTPLSVPRMYSNGYIPTYGSNDEMNPEVQLNNTGYKTVWKNKAETNITLEQNLDFVTKGLRFIGTFSFDTENENTINRFKNPELWRAERKRDSDGNLIMTRVASESLMSQSGESDGNRRSYTEAKLDYNTKIGEDHRITGLLMYYQQERVNTVNVTKDVRSSIPFRNIGLSGRATYGYKDRYLFDFNFGYTGSENFEPGERFGFFPAVSGAWVISEEPFVKQNVSWLDMFKIRYSYGEVGNDKLTDKDYEYEKRFPYMSFIDTSSSYNWGEYSSNYMQGYRITTIGSSNLTWETAKKHDIGLDLVLLKNKITFTIDAFTDHRSNIFIQRNLMPYSTGLQDLRPWANIGEMKSHGMDGVASYSDKIGKVNFTLRGNFTYATTDVLNYDEADNALWYQMRKGYRWNQSRGLVALGLFKDQEDIDNSPSQLAYGTYFPGDIKYKDVNGDGIINDDDIVPIGTTTVPSFVYGTGLSLSWKNFDFNILLQGAGMVDFFLSGNSVQPFSGGSVGNILEAMTNPEDRWISREISGTAATENSNAILPRLSYGSSSGSKNNFQQSTFWLRDGRYLRLKNLEFGYNFPRTLVQSLHATNMRLGFIGQNLMVFSPFKWWDPELSSSNGAKYPLSKTFSFNFTINF
ncbi:MAG: TonB-dependent receptor [Paludibacter sp.]|nr:TonB-dependent receptor [Paludibacter sp.]